MHFYLLSLNENWLITVQIRAHLYVRFTSEPVTSRINQISPNCAHSNCFKSLNGSLNETMNVVRPQPSNYQRFNSFAARCFAASSWVVCWFCWFAQKREKRNKDIHFISLQNSFRPYQRNLLTRSR